MAKQVFLSYSWQDATMVTTIRDHLEAREIAGWMAPRDLENWAQAQDRHCAYYARLLQHRLHYLHGRLLTKRGAMWYRLAGIMKRAGAIALC